MIKMIVCSFYNTLIDEEDAIPTSTMLELDRIKQKEIKLTILTNRLLEDVLYYNQDYPFIDYVIALNGSILYDVKENQKKLYDSFTKEELLEIQKKYEKKEIIYYTENASWTELPEDKVYKVEVKGIKKNIVSQYHTSIFQRNKEFFLEITKNSYSSTIQDLKEENLLGIIGNESEKELLEEKYKIYVVRNAPKGLKEKTSFLTKSNLQKGVELVIKKVIKYGEILIFYL